MLTVNHETNQETSYMNEAKRCNILLYYLTGRKNGLVVRTLPSHRCHLGLIPGDATNWRGAWNEALSDF